MSRARVIQRTVLVAMFLVAGTRSAAAWQALPGPPSVAPPEAPLPPDPVAPGPVAPQAPDVEVPGKHVIVGPPLVRVPPPAPARPQPVAPPLVVVRPPPPPPPGTSAGEWGRAVGQIVLGTAGMVVSGAAVIGAGEAAGIGPVIPLILAGPLGGGFVVCAIGRTSAYYEGGCRSSLGGAYLGALTAIPLALIIADNCTPDPAYAGYEGRAFECLGPAVFGAALGYTVGAALGATIGWHAGKKPRPAGAPGQVIPPPRDERPELGRGPSLSPARGLRLTLPLVAFAF